MATLTHALFDFLFDLDVNNDRAWFDANRERFERDVRGPFLAFIEQVQGPLATIAPHFVADPRKQGGSMFRIHRDTRFSKDKLPYKTWVAASFRHELGRDVHGPVFYLHLEPGNCRVGAGIWHPDTPTLTALRTSMVEDPTAWRRARNAVTKGDWELGGESLKRAPKGVDPEHPLIEDLRRKDLIAGTGLDEDDVVAGDFLDTFADHLRHARPLVRWVCRGVGVPY